jgi:hypothetical protein
MARKRTTPAKPAAKKVPPALVHEQGFWWIVAGTKRLNVGRNQKYAQRLLDEGLLPK